MHKILRGDFISVLEVDLNKIRNNILRLKGLLNEGQKFCAVVKADAYGLGAKMICSHIDDLVDYFAVSSGEEYLDICNVATHPILILDPIYENITKLAERGAEFCVSNREQLKLILKQSKLNCNINYKIHIAYNTGMNRFGFSREEDVCWLIDEIKKTQNVSIFGVFSHFYLGNRENFVKFQSRCFQIIKNKLVEKTDISKIVFHISNTSGFEFQKSFDMVRIGMGMFCFNNKYVFSLKTKICELRTLKQNDTVGYGLGFVARKRYKVAVCAIGYADGVPRCVAGKGFVLVHERLCKILAVCMDSIIIDVSSVNAKRGDCVTIFGENGTEQISCCNFASWCDTIDYEIMTGISKRVERMYLGVKTNANNNGKISSKKTCWS